MQTLLKRSGYFLLAILVITIEQLPSRLIKAGQPMWEMGLIILCWILITGASLYLAKRLGLVESWKNLKGKQAWAAIGLGFLALYVTKFLGGVILFLENGPEATTQNQALLGGVHPLLLFVLAVIVAPIVEEIVFRGLIMKRTFDNSYLGIAISSILFALLHLPTDIGSWVLYLGMGLVLGIVYWKTEKLEHVIMIHFLNNGLSVLLMQLLSLLQG